MDITVSDIAEPVDAVVTRSLAQWQEIVADALVPLDIRADAGDFQARLHHVEVGTCQLSDIRSRGQRVSRTARLAAHDSSRFLKAGIMLAGGGMFRQDGREVLLGPGDLVLYVTDRAYEFTFQDEFRFGVVMVGSDVADARLPGFDSVTARLVAGNSGPGLITGATLRALFTVATNLQRPAAVRASDAVLDLMDGCVASLSAASTTSDAARNALLRRACQLIELHLPDPDLSPPFIAATMGVSVSYLHRVFASFGLTVQGTIRRERLAAAHRDLADARHRRRTIAAIAAAWGFVDEGHFSRTFHAAYGLPPKSVRAEASLGGSPDGRNAET